jgi:metal-dependent amidase/aminoacylase/carboxypeptidase family protein
MRSEKMKQTIITYMNTLRNEIENLSKYLYNNPEENFCEFKAYKYVTNLLSEHNFKIEYNFLDIPTAFYAQFGSGHPKICYICKYSASSKEGHIYGNNASCAMSMAAALGLSKVINKTNGSVIILGCPGSNFNGAELTIAKQGALDDIDIVMAPHVDISNFESGTSMSVIPMKIEYISSKCFENSLEYYSPLDACLFTFNALSLLVKNFCVKCHIDGVSVKGEANPYACPSKAETKFYIRTQKMKEAEILENKIRNFIKAIAPILNVDYNISLFEIPSEYLITNRVLSRLFTHNLKESGIIDIKCCKDVYSGLSIGSISHTTPCIYPSIAITNTDSILYPSIEFAKYTISEFAHDIIMKSAQALALTGLDIIQKNDLLKEMTNELYTYTQ